MPNRYTSGLLAICVFALLSACGQDGAPAERAIGFVTPATVAVPASAEDQRGDGVLRDPDGRPFSYALLGGALPEVSMPGANTADFTTSGIDEWTIIEVWGVWCPDCVADGPLTAVLASRIGEREGLDFVSVHTPPSPARADEAFGRFGSVQAYFDAKGFSYPTVIDRNASVREAWQVAWTPTYLLVSPDGIVRGFRTDLSQGGDAPVDQFLADAEAVMREGM